MKIEKCTISLKGPDRSVYVFWGYIEQYAIELFHVINLPEFKEYFNDFEFGDDVASVSYEPDVGLYHVGYVNGEVKAGEDAVATPEIQWVIGHLDKIHHVAMNLLIRTEKEKADFFEF